MVLTRVDHRSSSISKSMTGANLNDNKVKISTNRSGIISGEGIYNLTDEQM